MGAEKIKEKINPYLKLSLPDKPAWLGRIFKHYSHNPISVDFDNENSLEQQHFVGYFWIRKGICSPCC